MKNLKVQHQSLLFHKENLPGLLEEVYNQGSRLRSSGMSYMDTVRSGGSLYTNTYSLSLVLELGM